MVGTQSVEGLGKFFIEEYGNPTTRYNNSPLELAQLSAGEEILNSIMTTEGLENLPLQAQIDLFNSVYFHFFRSNKASEYFAPKAEPSAQKAGREIIDSIVANTLLSVV